MVVNYKSLISSYNPEEPLNSIIKIIKNYSDYAAAAGKPVTEKYLIRISYGIVANTGVYQEGFRVWRNNSTNTWPSFQDHIIEAQSDLREHQKTYFQVGHGAHIAIGIQ